MILERLESVVYGSGLRKPRASGDDPPGTIDAWPTVT